MQSIELMGVLVSKIHINYFRERILDFDRHINSVSNQRIVL
jgi:hypothetical protein